MTTDAKKTKPDRRLVPFFFGFAVALGVGVPGVLFSLRFLADNITTLVASLIVLLGVTAVLATVFYVMRHRLFGMFRSKAGDSLREAYDPLVLAAERARSGDISAAFGQVEEAGRIMIAWYSWVLVRRWVLRLMLGLSATFAGLVGSALLYEQNTLIRQQNSYFQEQNGQLRQQVDHQAEIDYRLRRAGLVSRLYDEVESCVVRRQANNDREARCPPQASTRARVVAAETLVLLERDRAECSRAPALSKTLEDPKNCPRPNLREVELSYTNLNGADLRFADMQGARFFKTEFEAADLSGARLTGARLDQANMSGVSLRFAHLDSTVLRGCDLRRADLRGADLRKANLEGAQLDEAQLDGANLSGAVVDADLLIPSMWIKCGSGATRRIADKKRGC